MPLIVSADFKKQTHKVIEAEQLTHMVALMPPNIPISCSSIIFSSCSKSSIEEARSADVW